MHCSPNTVPLRLGVYVVSNESTVMSSKFSCSRVHLVEVATRLTIELPFLESVRSVAWKPGEPLPDGRRG